MDIQTVGVLLGGLGSFVTAVQIVAKRTEIQNFFKSATQKESDYRQSENARILAVARAEAAEALAKDYKGSLDEVRIRIDSLSEEFNSAKADFSSMPKVKEKLDALVDWTSLLLDFIVKLETRAKKGGVDLSDLTMPTVPASLADKFGVPEALQNLT